MEMQGGPGQMAGGGGGGRMMPMNPQVLQQHPQQQHGGMIPQQPQHPQMLMGQPQMMGHGGVLPQPQASPMQGHTVHPNLPGPQPQHPGHPVGVPSGQDSPKQDNISKAKLLMPTMKEALANVFRSGAEAVYANNLVDSGSKPVELDASRFDKALEEFHSVCDHMEMHLKAAMECISQGEMSNENLSAPVAQTKQEGSLTYPQYVGVVTGQITYAKEVHDALAEAAQKLLE